MTHNLPPNLLLKSASAFAREALNTVGYSSYTSGCVSHALQVGTPLIHSNIQNKLLYNVSVTLAKNEPCRIYYLTILCDCRCLGLSLPSHRTLLCPFSSLIGCAFHPTVWSRQRNLHRAWRKKWMKWQNVLQAKRTKECKGGCYWNVCGALKRSYWKLIWDVLLHM